VRLIYASSAATYGDGTSGFDDDATSEALARLQPLSSYGWSKHLFDRWVVRQIEAGCISPPQWCGLQFFNVYGPNEYYKGQQQSVVAQMFPRAVADAPAMLFFRSHNPDYPDGGQLRDFVWVQDVVELMLWMFQNFRHLRDLQRRNRHRTELARSCIRGLSLVGQRPARTNPTELPIFRRSPDRPPQGSGLFLCANPSLRRRTALRSRSFDSFGPVSVELRSCDPYDWRSRDRVVAR
jgi:hypothetical protein